MNQIIALCTSGKEMSRKKTNNIIFIRLAKNNGQIEEIKHVEIGASVLPIEMKIGD